VVTVSRGPVEVLAEALVDHGRIEGDQVEAIIDRSMGASSFDDFISSEKQLRGEYHAKRVSGPLINDE